MLDEPSHHRSVVSRNSCDIPVEVLDLLPPNHMQPAIPCEAPNLFLASVANNPELPVTASVFQRQSGRRFVPVPSRVPSVNGCNTRPEDNHTTDTPSRYASAVINPVHQKGLSIRSVNRKAETEKRKLEADDCSDSSDEEICQLLCQSSSSYCNLSFGSCPATTFFKNNNNNNNNGGCYCPAEGDHLNFESKQLDQHPPQSARAFSTVVPEKRFRPSPVTETGVTQRPYLNFDKMQKNTFHRKHSHNDSGRARMSRFKTIHRTL
jgi:hypothetical protein